MEKFPSKEGSSRFQPHFLIHHLGPCGLSAGDHTWASGLLEHGAREGTWRAVMLALVLGAEEVASNEAVIFRSRS